jgi:hypothetical protein
MEKERTVGVWGAGDSSPLDSESGRFWYCVRNGIVEFVLVAVAKKMRETIGPA